MAIDVFRGSNWKFRHQVKETLIDVAGVSTTTPLNLTGATLVSSIGGTPGWTGTPVVIDAPTGWLEVQVPTATTALYTPGTYPCDIKVTKGGIVDTSIKFDINVQAVVTPP